MPTLICVRGWTAEVDPAYVGLIDTRRDPAERRLRKGLDALHLLPFSDRVRLQLGRLAPPEVEPVSAVLGSILRRSVRSVIELPQRGWRSRHRRRPETWTQSRMNYMWNYRPITIPVHLYNCANSMRRYTPGDPSLGYALRLRGGYVLRMIEGDHDNCILPPRSAAVSELIAADRAAAIADGNMRP